MTIRRDLSLEERQRRTRQAYGPDGSADGSVQVAAPPPERPKRHAPSSAANRHIVGDGVNKITVSDTAPTSPQVGDLWVDTS